MLFVVIGFSNYGLNIVYLSEERCKLLDKSRKKYGILCFVLNIIHAEEYIVKELFVQAVLQAFSISKNIHYHIQKFGRGKQNFKPGHKNILAPEFEGKTQSYMALSLLCSQYSPSAVLRCSSHTNCLLLIWQTPAFRTFPKLKYLAARRAYDL
jgi:hypothetical protein